MHKSSEENTSLILPWLWLCKKVYYALYIIGKFISTSAGKSRRQSRKDNVPEVTPDVQKSASHFVSLHESTQNCNQALWLDGLDFQAQQNVSYIRLNLLCRRFCGPQTAKFCSSSFHSTSSMGPVLVQGNVICSWLLVTGYYCRTE